MEEALWTLVRYSATTSCILQSSLPMTDVELNGDMTLWSLIYINSGILSEINIVKSE